MAKVLCVLFADPVDGKTGQYARTRIPVITHYPDGTTAPSPHAIRHQKLLICWNPLSDWRSGRFGAPKLRQSSVHGIGQLIFEIL